MLLFAVVTPLLFLPLAATPLFGRRWGRLLPALAPLPALAASPRAAELGIEEVDWLLLGSRFGLTEVTGPLLLLTSLLWMVAGAFAARYIDGRRAGTYWLFHLLTLTGNLGLLCAQDVPGFYTFFALMTFAGYGLVVHARTEKADRAGRVYLTMALLGEALLLAALFVAVAHSESLLLADVGPAVAAAPARDWILLAAFLGFGVKAGALGIHFWLPLAHPVAPTPASAVLSGAMIKAGLLGWTYLFPGGEAILSGWSGFLVAIGLAAAFYAVACGLFQRDPKTVLAYSSVSQMGLMTAFLGAGLVDPDRWSDTLRGVASFAVNHGLAKGALFLGVGVVSAWIGASRHRRWMIMTGLGLAALSIAGVPPLGGFAPKQALKEALGGAGPTIWLLSLSSAATTLLLGRFLLMMRSTLRSGDRPHGDPRLWRSWAVALGAAVAGGRLSVLLFEPPSGLGFYPGAVWEAIWPVLLGGTALWMAEIRFPNLWSSVRISAGDLLSLVERGIRSVRRLHAPVARPEFLQVNLVLMLERLIRSRRVQERLSAMERSLTSWETAGLSFVLLMLILWLLSS